MPIDWKVGERAEGRGYSEAIEGLLHCTECNAIDQRVYRKHRVLGRGVGGGLAGSMRNGLVQCSMHWSNALCIEPKGGVQGVQGVVGAG